MILLEKIKTRLMLWMLAFGHFTLKVDEFFKEIAYRGIPLISCVLASFLLMKGLALIGQDSVGLGLTLMFAALFAYRYILTAERERGALVGIDRLLLIIEKLDLIVTEKRK